MMKTLVILAFAAACVAVIPSAHAQIVTEEVVTTPPKASPGDFGDWDARRNIIESRHYDLLLQTNPAFPRREDASGMRANHRSAAARRLPGELRPI